MKGKHAMSKIKILQIMPAVDWWGSYKMEDGLLSFDPLVCWALVQETDISVRQVEGIYTAVIGMINSDGAIENIENTTNFEDYYTTADKDEYEKENAKAITAAKKR